MVMIITILIMIMIVRHYSSIGVGDGGGCNGGVGGDVYGKNLIPFFPSLSSPNKCTICRAVLVNDCENFHLSTISKIFLHRAANHVKLNQLVRINQRHCVGKVEGKQSAAQSISQ